MTAEIVRIPFRFDGETIPVVRLPNGDQGLPLRALTVPVGLDPDGQRKLIQRSSWSKGRTDNMYVRLPGDDRVRQHFVISHRIVPMWVANIETSRMSDEAARERIERWQVELADALYDYVFSGGAINPRASREQLDAIAETARRQMDVLRLMDGIVDARWLEAKAREVAARALGEEPEPALDARLLTVGEYLDQRGATDEAIRRLSGNFGKKLKAAFILRHGEQPRTSRRFVSGAQRDVAVYTEADRDLFDQVWAEIGGA